MFGERFDPRPIKTKLFRDRKWIDTSLSREIGDHGKQVFFRSVDQRLVERRKCRVLFGCICRRKVEEALADRNLNLRQPCDGIFKLYPPEARGALGKAFRDIHGEGRGMLFKDRQGNVARILVTIVERKDRKLLSRTFCNHG